MRQERGRIFGLVALLVAASVITGTIASLILYRTALREKSNFLLTEVQNLARLINAVAKFDRNTFADVDKATRATLSQVEDAFKSQTTVGESGEILMGRNEDKKIVIFLRYRDQKLNQNLILPLNQERSEIMARALRGETGVGEFADLNGEAVLAAYTYIPYLKTGLEVKIPMAEILKPYLVSGVVIALASGLVILFCIYLFVRISRPVLAELEKHRMLTEAVVDSAQDIIISINPRGFLQLVNPAAKQLTGYAVHELTGKDFSLLFDIADDGTQTTLEAIRSGRFENLSKQTVRLRKKNGETFPASISSGTKLLGDDPMTTIVLHDLTELKKNEDTIRMLTHRMIEIKDEEQDNISKELHDTIGTNLVWLKLQVQQLLASFQEKKTETAALIESFDDTIEMTRNLSHHLSPVAVEKLTLRVLFERLAERAARFTQTHFDIRHEIPDPEFPARTRFHVFRIVQEILNNVLKHARAKNVTIRTEKKARNFSIHIADDGRGFDTEVKHDGLGLSLIAERVRLLKGTLSIKSQPEKGTEVAFEFPVA